MKKNKVLHVVRHAKSSWDYDGIADIDRTLKSKGIRNAYEIARKLKLSNNVPDMMVSSPADRALHTAIIFARVFEFPLGNLQINEILYEFSKDQILDIIRDFDDSKHSLMIFGHNPGCYKPGQLFYQKVGNRNSNIRSNDPDILMSIMEKYCPGKHGQALFYFPSKEE